MGRGYFGIGVYHPKTAENIGTLWRSAMAFNAAYIFTIGRRYTKQSSDTPKTPRHIPLLHFETVEQMLECRPHGARIVGVEYPGKRALQSWSHPDQAIYLLGSEDNGLPKPVLDICDSVVEIEGLPFSLNVATAGSIVMYDRAMKGMV